MARNVSRLDHYARMGPDANPISSLNLHLRVELRQSFCWPILVYIVWRVAGGGRRKALYRYIACGQLKLDQQISQNIHVTGPQFRYRPCRTSTTSPTDIWYQTFSQIRQYLVCQYVLQFSSSFRFVPSQRSSHKAWLLRGPPICAFRSGVLVPEECGDPKYTYAASHKRRHRIF